MTDKVKPELPKQPYKKEPEYKEGRDEQYNTYDRPFGGESSYDGAEKSTPQNTKDRVAPSRSE